MPVFTIYIVKNILLIQFQGVNSNKIEAAENLTKSRHLKNIRI